MNLLLMVGSYSVVVNAQYARCANQEGKSARTMQKLELRG